MSELRNYVLEKFANGQEYSREEITDFISQRFGQEAYTAKQLQNLLYNLTKLNKIERTKHHGYKIVQDMGNSTFAIEQYIGKLKEMCISTNNDLMKKNFLERYKGIDLNSLNEIYYMNKKILKDVSECEKKIGCKVVENADIKCED